jgi:hypothetical protein
MLVEVDGQMIRAERDGVAEEDELEDSEGAVREIPVMPDKETLKGSIGCSGCLCITREPACA